MFLLAATLTPGTSYAVSGAMANPFGSDRMIQDLCAGLVKVSCGDFRRPSEAELTLGPISGVSGVQQLPDPANVFPKPISYSFRNWAEDPRDTFQFPGNRRCLGG
jgi:hypothetical protein